MNHEFREIFEDSNRCPFEDWNPETEDSRAGLLPVFISLPRARARARPYGRAAEEKRANAVLGTE